MPREKKLRKRISLVEPTGEDMDKIFHEDYFQGVVPPARSAEILSIKYGEKLIGFASILRGPGRQAEIESIEILKEYQRRGLGRKVLGKISAMLLRQKIRHQYLTSTASARTFYDKTNFKEQKGTNERVAVFKKRKP